MLKVIFNLFIQLKVNLFRLSWKIFRVAIAYQKRRDLQGWTIFILRSIRVKYKRKFLHFKIVLSYPVVCLTTCAVCTSKTTQTLVNWRLRLPTRLQRAVLNKPRSFLYLRTLERKVILLLLALQHRNVNNRLVASVFGKKDSTHRF